MSALHEPDRLPDSFTAFCREKGLTQADIDMIVRALSSGPYIVTNDGQPKRAPMLSEAKLTGRNHGPEPDKATNDGKDWLNWWGKMNDTPGMDAWEVQAYYEDLIDKGVLAVVKTAHSTGVRTSDFLCSECRGWTPMTLSPKFCMHCSAKIHNP